jgi:hypothetical protein
MSDRTYMRTYIYACPDDQQAAALAVLRPDDGPAGRLVLDEPYEEPEVPCGYSADLASTLAAAAPGASFVMWEDPGWGSLGELHARAPELGGFTGECTAGGVLLTLDEILEILDGAGSLRAARAGLHRRMAGPWMDDWAARTRVQADPVSAGAPVQEPATDISGIGPGALDDLVHDAAGQAASAVSNDGPAAQLAYLTESYGPASVTALISQHYDQPADGPEK